ncbi:hypothetical protein BBJ28_00008054 [Nothophytophthora sp. Chile5]|nr:hypothetical protein BBJ28_00008054 [Nothophytophthora sp. Chile5]
MELPEAQPGISYLYDEGKNWFDIFGRSSALASGLLLLIVDARCFHQNSIATRSSTASATWQLHAMNRKLAFDNRLCYERDVARQHAVHQRKIEEVVVTSQSVSKVFLDSNAPAPQRHLATNAKRLQLERDKQLDIFHQNQRLASKMERISHRQENLILAASSSSTARSPSPLKSHARGPLKAPQTAEGRAFAMGRGDACKKPSLVNRVVQKRRQAAIEAENRRLKERLGRLKPYYDTKKWDDEWQDHAHKFNHLRQDGTVGYLLPPPSKKSMPSSRGGCKTSRESGTTRGSTPASRGLPSLGGSKRSVSRGDRLQQQQSIRLKPVSGSSESSAESGRDGDAGLEEEEEMQVRELAPFTLLEATTRQGVALIVNELEIEVIHVDSLEMDWAVRFKMASMLNLEGRRWRTILRKDPGIYLVSSWFEEETGVQIIKTIAVGKAAMETTSWVVEVVYDLSEMEALMRQLEGGTLSVPELLAEKVTHLLP